MKDRSCLLLDTFFTYFLAFEVLNERFVLRFLSSSYELILVDACAFMLSRGADLICVDFVEFFAVYNPVKLLMMFVMTPSSGLIESLFDIVAILFVL